MNRIIIMWWFLTWATTGHFSYIPTFQGPFQSERECKTARDWMAKELTRFSDLTISQCTYIEARQEVLS